MTEEHGAPGEVRRVDVGEEFRVCPECGYENGFHVTFRPAGQGDSMDWLFVCPNCSSQFDLGLKVRRD